MTQYIGFRCPDDLAEIIQKRKSATGRDTTYIMVEALRFWLENKPLEEIEISTQSDERLQELVDFKTAYLADAMNEIKHSLESRTEALENEVQALKLRLDSLAPATPITTKPVTISTAKPTAIAAKATNARPTCPQCQSTISIGNGKDRHGLPRYKCKDCGKTFTWS